MEERRRTTDETKKTTVCPSNRPEKKNQKPKTRNAVKDEEEMNVVDINRRPQRERERESGAIFAF